MVLFMGMWMWCLAETFGDLWRTQTPKGHKVWELERYIVHLSLLIHGVTVLLWINEAGGSVLGEDGSQWFWGGYGLWITMIFSGVMV